MCHTAGDAGRSLLWADRFVIWCAVVSVPCTVWYVAVVIRPVGPILLGWSAVPVCVLLAAATCWRAGSDSAVPAPARLFWRRCAVALGVLGLSIVCQTVTSVNPDLSMTARPGPMGVIGHASAAGIVAWAIFRLPVAKQGKTQRMVVIFDLGIMVAASAVFLWHFSVRHALLDAGMDGSTVATSLTFMVVGLGGAIMAAKMALTGSEVLADDALQVLGWVLVIGSLGSPLGLLLFNRPYVDTSLLIVPPAALLLAIAARLQVVADRAGRVRTRRRSSLLPYAAVAATDVLLLVAIAQNTSDRLLVGCVAVVLTALVAARQAAAFRENERLLARLDTGLLELRRREERFRSLVQNSSDVVTITDRDAHVTYVSPAVLPVLGYQVDDVIGIEVARLTHPDDAAEVNRIFASLLGRPGAMTTYDARVAHADGSWRWLEVVSANLLDDPSVAGIVSNGRDVTETRAVQNRLAYEATHDSLTGLANRTLFGERLGQALARTVPSHPLSIVLVDLDDFKTVNDTLGHSVGDALLIVVASRMRGTMRPGDMVARLGGDEFAILIENAAPEDVDRLLVRIGAALSEPLLVEGHLLSARASFGVADGNAANDAGELLRQADIAMYEAKRRGEGGHERYRDGMEVRGAELSRLTAALLTALEEEQFVLHYQPVVTLPGGAVAGVEALVRWQHPHRGLLAPVEFIPGAEENGLIVALGRWVLREACRQLAEWVTDFGVHAPATVAVNVSARQLQAAGFAAELAAALRDAGLPAERLIVEITESTAVGGGATQQNLKALSAIGVRLSLDDFGTGASTLSLLTECQVHQIKLDRSFVPVPGLDAIAAAVIQLARAFRVEVVAEGVETAEQADRLHRLGYELAQGFYFARPLAAADIAVILAAAATVFAAGSLGL